MPCVSHSELLNCSWRPAPGPRSFQQFWLTSQLRTWSNENGFPVSREPLRNGLQCLLVLIPKQFSSLTGICGLLSCFSSHTGHFLCLVWTAENVFYWRSLMMILVCSVLEHRTDGWHSLDLYGGFFKHVVLSNVLSCLVRFVHPCSRSPQCWFCFSAVVQVLPSSWHLKGNTMTSKRQAFEEHRRT